MVLCGTATPGRIGDRFNCLLATRRHHHKGFHYLLPKISRKADYALTA